MEDNNLFALVWKLAAAVLCVVVLSISGCNSYGTAVRVHAINQMVNKGADPIRAACSIRMQDGDGSQPVCIQSAGK